MDYKVPIAVSAIGLLLNIVGLAIPYWLDGTYTASFGGFSVELDINAGLWKYCDDDQCHDLREESETDSLKAVRAMEILGVLILTGAIGCAVLKVLQKMKGDVLLKVAGACAAVAGAFMIIGCIVFATTYKDDPYVANGFNLHAAFAICIVAGVDSIVASVLFFMVKDD